MLNCILNRVSEQENHYNLQEKTLYHTWLFQNFQQERLKTVCGKPLSIIDPGKRNLFEGPDFKNAQLLIGDRLVTGDVEIHVHNSDWYAHQHQYDPVYNNVILHVVVENSGSETVDTQSGRRVPVFRLHVNAEHNPTEPPCQNWAGFDITRGRNKLAEFADLRFRRKGQLIKKGIIEKSANLIFYQLICDGLGYSQNRGGFRLLAETLPLSKIYSILDQSDDGRRIITLETLLLGTAGFIEGPHSKYLRSEAKYFLGLKNNWKSLKCRYNLVLPELNWHFAGIRPANFPTRRLTALAQILAKFYPEEPAQLWINLLMTHSEIHPIQDWIRNYFQQPSGMWRNHPLLKNFRGNVLIGNRRMMDLVSNLFLPFGWAVASLRSDRVLLDRLMRLSRAVPAGEVPAAVSRWSVRIGLQKKFFTRNYLIQGAIELRHSFCDMELCKLCPLEEYEKYR